MTKRSLLLAGLTLLLGVVGPALWFDQQCRSSVPFAVATAHFEQNATDRDAEVVFEVKGGDQGLAKLTVASPDGRTVIDFAAPDASTLGMRQFQFESPEPGDIESLKSAYPEGVYTFTGTTAAGDQLQGTATLSHKLPAATSLLRPGAGARGVGVKHLKISWAPVENVAAYLIEIEQDELEVKVKARLPGSVTTFVVPDGFLRPGTEYLLGIGTVTKAGNVSFVETTFTTAEYE